MWFKKKKKPEKIVPLLDSDNNEDSTQASESIEVNITADVVESEALSEPPVHSSNNQDNDQADHSTNNDLAIEPVAHHIDDEVKSNSSSRTSDEADGVALDNGLKKTRGLFSRLFSGFIASKIDDSWYEDLEDQMIMSDVGFDTTTDIIDELKRAVKQNKVSDEAGARQLIHNLLDAQLQSANEDNWTLFEQHPSDSANHTTKVILVVGINGVGKTTTVAKLAHFYQQQGQRVMLAACDTFRAAAIEQLQSWGSRLNIPVIAAEHGADAAATAHDAYQSAIARQADILIIDTAGRQHTHQALMDQLGKVRRVLQKQDPSIPHETWIVLDAGNGQNTLSQIEQFNQMTPLTGMCLTKLDGTAKGGVIFAITRKHHLPTRFLGLGEKIDDLKAFNSRAFIDALLP